MSDPAEFYDLWWLWWLTHGELSFTLNCTGSTSFCHLWWTFTKIIVHYMLFCCAYQWYFVITALFLHQHFGMVSWQMQYVFQIPSQKWNSTIGSSCLYQAMKVTSSAPVITLFLICIVAGHLPALHNYPWTFDV